MEAIGDEAFSSLGPLERLAEVAKATLFVQPTLLVQPRQSYIEDGAPVWRFSRLVSEKAPAE